MSFLICTGCGRHVRGDASSCPFCSIAAVPVADKRPRRRMARSALFAGALLATSACGDSDLGAPEPDASDACVPYDAPVFASYGASPPRDGGCP